MLKLRILSAALLAPPALLAVWYGPPVFDMMAAFGAAILAWEWERMCDRRFGPAGAMLAIMGVVAAMFGAVDPALCVTAILLTAIAEWLLARQRGAAKWWMASGALYIGLPIMALVSLRAGEGGRETLIWLLLVVWATDTGAYAAGRIIGGPKLAPRISPNKTWAGLGGGMACAAVVGAAFAWNWQAPHMGGLAAVSAALAVVAQAGDLLESFVKRHFGVKDSSQIIPGHGGLFDRIDGLLSAAPVVSLALVVAALFGDGAAWGVLAWR